MSGFTQRLANQIASGDPVSVRRALDELVDSMQVKVVTAELDHDQILALPTTPVEIVPAPGADKVIILKDVVLHKTIAVTYGNCDSDGAYITAVIGNDDLEGLELAVNVPAGSPGLVGFLTADDYFYWFRYQHPHAATFPSANPEPFGPSCIDAAAFLYADNKGNGDFEDGDAGDIVKVTSYYMVMDV